MDGHAHGLQRPLESRWQATRSTQIPRFIDNSLLTINKIEKGGKWWAVVPEEEWPEDPMERATLREGWDPVYGDRQIELVVIGIKMEKQGVRAALEECLVTDEEFAMGPEAWAQFPDPFMKWEDDDEEDDDEEDDDEEEDEEEE